MLRASLLGILQLVAISAALASDFVNETPEFKFDIFDNGRGERIIICSQPTAPRDAEGHFLEGTVLLDIVVGENGRPHSVEVSEGSGSEIIDAHAVSVASESYYPDEKGMIIEQRYTYEVAE